ncbi:MAG: carboxypeptidase-like regulatory domain-containing protein, partial [Muribaculaceae bacterium]|nr:carboxypeptidase-like regulatory domain-containing protein [Muribaculaceae bacterium]
MKRNVALTLLISAISLPAICADYKVSGKVISKADGDICPGATYRIFLSSDTVTPAAFNVTDAEGYFNQALPSEGDYIMKIEYIGMKDALRNFTLTKDSPSAGLGAIALSPDDETLDELVVVAKKKLVESDGATLTYNVEDDPESQTNSTIEMLRKVPM